MKVIGITGGVGSGKSEVLNYIGRHYEAAVVQADEAAHLLMQPGGACYPAVMKLLGPGQEIWTGKELHPSFSMMMSFEHRSIR